jgi:CRP/FNR family transcriptional regulator
LAKLLLRKADASHQVALSHQELADELGSAREVVSRQLKEFEKRGWVTVGRKSIDLLTTCFIDEI